MTTAFQSNAFQNNAFQIDSAVVTVDTHDPGAIESWIKYREEIKRQERLLAAPEAQIDAAEIAEEIRQEMLTPEVMRVELPDIKEAVIRAYVNNYRAILEDDEDVVWLLN